MTTFNNLAQDVKPISYIKTHAADMMKHIDEHRSPILITQHGDAKAVLMDVESYQTMQQAFSLLRLIQVSENQVDAGKLSSADTVFSNLEKKLAAKTKST